MLAPLQSLPFLTLPGRDFTVNALLWDPLSGLLFDYVGGLDDLSGRVLRAIGDPASSFAADATRVLRGVRVAARTGEGSTAKPGRD
jgi:poly(A) polymerase